MLILDRLDRLDETLAGIAQRIEALEARIDQLGEEKARRDPSRRAHGGAAHRL